MRVLLLFTFLSCLRVTGVFCTNIVLSSVSGFRRAVSYKRLISDQRAQTSLRKRPQIFDKQRKMGLLKKACRRVWNRLSSGKRACKPARCCSSEGELGAVDLVMSATSASALPGLRSLEAASFSHETDAACCCPPAVVNVTAADQFNPRGAGGEVKQTMLTATTRESAWNVSSESDSGVCLGEEFGEGPQEDDACSVWSEEDEGEEDFECECDECSFARCETILEDWHISAKDLMLDKVLSRRQEERVYR